MGCWQGFCTRRAVPPRIQCFAGETLVVVASGLLVREEGHRLGPQHLKTGLLQAKKGSGPNLFADGLLYLAGKSWPDSAPKVQCAGELSAERGISWGCLGRHFKDSEIQSSLFSYSLEVITL